MKNIINALASALVVAVMLQGCNTLEVTMPKGPQGEQGIQGKDGLSAYEVWLQALKDGILTGWDGGTALTDFFLYLKGKDGTDGKDGKSAYEVWKEYVASGVADPHNPGKQWDKDRTSVADFYWFLTGRDGADGLVPFIGDNGNWWIGDTDTGKPARGDKGDKGDPGADGLSAYEAWRDYVAGESREGRVVKDAEGNVYTEANSTIHDFFLFLTGRAGADGRDGRNGRDGEDGSDGKDGLSAYDLWVADVTSPQGLEDPHEPGRLWDPSRTTLQDFWYYLQGASGSDGSPGADGLSAYGIWKALVSSDDGLANPGNGAYSLDEYPLWPKDRTGYADFFDYLRGRDGENGEDGRDGRDASASPGDTILIHGAVRGMYNLTAVPALKVRSCGPSGNEPSEWLDFINPYTGGAWFVATGPEGELLPGCEVTFSDVRGGVYSKTADEEGCIYLSRGELPEYSPGDPSAYGNPTRPSSFRFGGREITDPSQIAASCVVPYRVGLSARMISSTLSYNAVESRVAVYRLVEGVEEQVFVAGDGSPVRASFPNPECFSVCMSRVDSTNQVRVLEGAGSSVVSAASRQGLSKGQVYMGSFFRKATVRPRTYTPDRNTGYVQGVFGDGAAPTVVSVHSTPYSMMKVVPDYGLGIVTPERTHVPEIRYMEGFDTEGAKGGCTSYNGKEVADASGNPVPVRKTNYELILGQTSLGFALDWHSFGQCYAEGEGTMRDGAYEFRRFDSLDAYLATLNRSPEVSCRLSVEGKLNGVDISNSVEVKPSFSVSDHALSDGSYIIRNVYDAFSVNFTRARIGSVSYEGLSGTFRYGEGGRYKASCILGSPSGTVSQPGFQETYTFQAIVDGLSEPFSD